MITATQTSPLLSKDIIIAIASILVSGCCWYLSIGLSGDYGWLLWIAPVPVMISSFKSTGKIAFVSSFTAYLIGRLSWFSYLVTVATMVPAILFTAATALVFAFIALMSRRIVIKTNSWYAVFAFPVLFTTFEFLFMTFAPDGTAGSIAYSQLNFLPLIQIASVTGMLGITFFVTFIPSAITVGWLYRRDKIKFQYITGTSVAIILTVFAFGIIYLNSGSETQTLKVGLVVLDDTFHYVTNNPDPEKEIETATKYARLIASLSAQGAEVVVLPERAMNITSETDSALMSILMATARQNHIILLTGYTNFRQTPETNSALVIETTGKVIRDYNKAHLIKGLESQFKPGTEAGLFTLKGMQAGTAICKDLDFPSYIKKYGASNVHVLFTPAWDFVVDDWLHSRMAVLRSVENGFSQVRTARLGRLTINDCYGRVTYEANCSNGKAAVLVGKVPLQKRNTIYTRFGDWFGIANIISAICFILFAGKKARRDIADV